MTIDVRVTRISYKAEGIHAFLLARPDGAPLPSFTAGAHIEVELPNGLSRPYSLFNQPGETAHYEIAVQREPAGRGGSRFIHDTVRVGDVLAVSPPKNHFGLVETATRHILIGGGIGITPLLAMAHRLNELGAEYTLHYCARTEDRMAFRADAMSIASPAHLRLHVDDGDPSKGLDVADLLSKPSLGTHVYCCGPVGLLAAVQRAGAAWSKGTLHFESFALPSLPPVDDASGPGFEVEVASTGQIVQVDPHRTILEALREQGIEVGSSCEAGTCGECKTRLLGGTADHLDYVLTDDEQRDWIMVCVSRAKSRRLKLGI